MRTGATSPASTWWATLRCVHVAAIHAQAQAELAALHGWPQPSRCRAGSHVGGPGCHEHPQVDHEPPLTDADVQTHLAALAAAAALPRYRAGLHAIPLEVWAAQC